jgi:hypothetical protein
MTLPSAPTKVHLDAASDDPAQARSELATAIDAIGSLITHLGTSSLTSGSSVASATGGVEVSSTSLRTALSFTTKTTTYTALTTDRGKVINFTTAGFDLDFTAAATLGDGWWCIARNSAASGDLGLDPNSTESINGSSSSIALRPGDMALITSNGTALFALIMRAPATQTEMEAATGATAMVTPANLQWHPGVAKAWVKGGVSGGTPAADASLNLTSITDNGVGDFTFNWTTAFSSANYAFMPASSAVVTRINGLTASTARMQCFSDLASTGSDPGTFCAVAFGDQ